MRFWPRPRDNPVALFRWSDANLASFVHGFHTTGLRNIPIRTVCIAITHESCDQSSWDLTTERRFYGWLYLGLTWRLKSSQGAIPAQLNIGRELVERPYEERSSRNWQNLDQLGSLDIWQRGNGDSPDGVEINLTLDQPRRRALKRSIRKHVAPAPMMLTLALTRRIEDEHANTPVVDLSESGRVPATEGLIFPILAYWLRTWPRAHDKDAQPWAIAEMTKVFNAL